MTVSLLAFQMDVDWNVAAADVVAFDCAAVVFAIVFVAADARDRVLSECLYGDWSQDYLNVRTCPLVDL